MRGCRVKEKGKLRLKMEEEEKRRHTFKGESQGKISEDGYSGSEHTSFFRRESRDLII
jgi:hypothetical protein